MKARPSGRSSDRRETTPRFVGRALTPSAAPVRSAPQVGDVLRATVICESGDALLLVYRAIERAFELREGNGRLKNVLNTKMPTPPRMLLNVMLDGEMAAEIQLFLREIKELAVHDHKYYEVLRAGGLDELLAEAQQKPIEAAAPAKEDGATRDLIKVAPAESWVEASVGRFAARTEASVGRLAASLGRLAPDATMRDTLNHGQVAPVGLKAKTSSPHGR